MNSNRRGSPYPIPMHNNQYPILNNHHRVNDIAYPAPNHPFRTSYNPHAIIHYLHNQNLQLRRELNTKRQRQSVTINNNELMTPPRAKKSKKNVHYQPYKTGKHTRAGDYALCFDNNSKKYNIYQILKITDKYVSFHPCKHFTHFTATRGGTKYKMVRNEISIATSDEVIYNNKTYKIYKKWLIFNTMPFFCFSCIFIIFSTHPLV